MKKIPGPCFRTLLTTLLTALLILGIYAPGLCREKALDLTLIANHEPATAGKMMQFTILFTNSGNTAVALGPYQTIQVKLSGGGITAQTTATAASLLGSTSVPASGFFRQTYQISLPENISGTVSMSAKDIPANQILFSAAQMEETVMTAATSEKPSIHALKDLQHPFLNNFSTYEPIYFLFGVQPGIDQSKFQLSFKYRLFTLKEDRLWKAYLPWLEDLHFAYTQTSFWDLKSSSAPFEDSRYMPELFYYNDNINIDLHPHISIGFQAGYQHESNGRGGDLSRSTNHAYIKPIFVYGMGNDLFLKFAPKAWIYVNNEDENNPDLFRYRGYVDLETKVGSARGLVLETHLRAAEKGLTLQADLSFPMKRLIKLDAIADFYLHAQYFSGYAENLLNYREREQVFRLGLSLIR